jgi:hypothetical protein
MDFLSPVTLSVILVLVVANWMWWLGPATRAFVEGRWRWSIDGWLDVVFWIAISLAILKNMPQF